MEKYCPKCHKIYDNDKSNKFCLNCGTKLKTREKRKPIPPKLRHEIFVRDGYRCRECGKSKEETSLEIDHIYPLSKGGSTTEDNLWVLCRECNQAKKDNVWKDDEIEIVRNALSNLENQLHEAEVSLKVATTEEEIFALKAKIKDFKENKIPHDEKKLKELIQDEERINAERKAQLKENERRKNLFNKLYVQVEGELLLEVCNHFSLTESSDKDNIRLLIDKYGEQEIYTTINSIKKELEEEAIRIALYDKLDNTISPDEINLFVNEFSFKGSKNELLNYLIYNYSEDEIESLKVKLVEKEQKRIEEEKRIKEEERKLEEERIKEEKRIEEERLAKEARNNLKNYILTSFTPKEFYLFRNEFNLSKDHLEIANFLIDNYNEKEIKSLRIELNEKEQQRLEKRKELHDRLLSQFVDLDFKLFSEEFSLIRKDNEKIVNYLIDNYNENEIFDLNSKLIKQAKHNLLMELKASLDIRQLLFLCKYFSVNQCTKADLMKNMERYSFYKIMKAIELMEEDTKKHNTRKIISNPSEPKKLIYKYYCNNCYANLDDVRLDSCPYCGSIDLRFSYR